jgi:hypothetical protein
MKKFFIPLIAVLAVAGVLFASPIMAGNGRGGNCGDCPGTEQACPGTECPADGETGGDGACPRWEDESPATSAAADEATPPGECPRDADGVCPREEGCGGAGEGCGRTEGGCSRVENCPADESTPAGVDGEPEAACPWPGEEGACPGMNQDAPCAGSDEARGCGRGAGEGAAQAEGLRGGCGMMR